MGRSSSISNVTGINKPRLSEPLLFKMKRLSGNTLIAGLTYLILTGIAFMFLLPLIGMITSSFMTREDMLNPAIKWIPRIFTIENYQKSLVAMSYVSSLVRSLCISIAAAIGATFASALIGYGLARSKFWGRELIFFLVLFTFIVPPQTIIVSLFMIYKKLKWIDTYLPMVIPAFLGFGLRGEIFILIFRQYFRGLPWELEDAARIDGCNEWRIFRNIMFPLSKAPALVCFLFSLVWNYNNYYEPSIYLSSMSKQVLAVKLNLFYYQQQLIKEFGWSVDLLNTQVVMAGCTLVILPMLILYMFTQKYFVESIERTGLVD